MRRRNSFDARVVPPAWPPSHMAARLRLKQRPLLGIPVFNRAPSCYARINLPLLVFLRTPLEIKRRKTSSHVARSTVHSRCACDRVTHRPGISAYSACTCFMSVRIAWSGVLNPGRTCATATPFLPPTPDRARLQRAARTRWGELRTEGPLSRRVCLDSPSPDQAQEAPAMSRDEGPCAPSIPPRTPPCVMNRRPTPS